MLYNLLSYSTIVVIQTNNNDKIDNLICLAYAAK